MRPLTAVLLFLLPLCAPAREDIAVCGSYWDRLQEEVRLHQESMRRIERLRGAVVRHAADAGAQRPASRDIGNIVVMEDSDGVVARRNEFDLDGMTITFTPVDAPASGYRFALGGPGYDEAAAQAGTLLSGLDDDDARLIDLPFAFPFFGQTYTQAYVNSDGNLTFGGPDANSSERSLGRVTTGPPRIAPLFRDLDPTRARDGVRVFLQPAVVAVTWSSVPEFSTFGQGRLQTFQVRLHFDGRVEFAYNGISTDAAVTGIAPGDLQGATAVVSFLEGSDTVYPAAVLERFTLLREVDIVLAAQKFYEQHDDTFDYLVIFNDLGIPAASGAVAFEVTLRNQRTGYGDFIVDIGKEFGSPSRLQAMMNMGPMSQYPEDPNAVVPARSAAGDTPLTILGHEAGHLFLAYASTRTPNDPAARPLLGRQAAHWNFSFNSEASLLEGNRICDRERTPDQCPAFPPNGRFVTTATVEGYAPLDQYLMGLRPSWEVPDTFLVENSTIFNPSRSPEPGVAFNGVRRDVRVDEIIAAEGRRTPDYTVAQRHFRFAFILVVAEGAEPSAAALAKLDRYRQEFEGFYHRASQERAWAHTELKRGLSLSTFPASGVLLNGAATATVTIEEPAVADLEVLLATQSGSVQVPASVTIPAGATQAEFTITGADRGVDELIAESAGGVYHAAYSKIQVAEPGQLRFQAVSGDRQVGTPGQPVPQPVVVRVTDINDLPYPGLRVAVTATGGSVASPSIGVTDAAGEIAVGWVLGGQGGDQIQFRLTDFPDGPALAVGTTGVPVFTGASVVNAADYAAGLAPGGLATMFGLNLGAGVTATATLPLPVELAEVRVLVNGEQAQLLYVSDSQINFVLPRAIFGNSVQIAVETPAGETGPITVPVTGFAPAIFVMPGSGLAAAQVTGTGQLTSDRPAGPGEFIEVYCTGLGAVFFRSATQLFETITIPQVSIGGVAATVLYSGLAPGWDGLYQVNVQVPAGVPAGPQPLAITIGDRQSNAPPVQLQ